MSRPANARLAVLGVLALAFLLEGCGRKGPLDAPPGAWVTPRGTAPIRPDTPPPEQVVDEDGKVIAPAGPKRRLPGDWLID